MKSIFHRTQLKSNSKEQTAELIKILTIPQESESRQRMTRINKTYLENGFRYILSREVVFGQLQHVYYANSQASTVSLDLQNLLKLF